MQSRLITVLAVLLGVATLVLVPWRAWDAPPPRLMAVVVQTPGPGRDFTPAEFLRFVGPETDAQRPRLEVSILTLRAPDGSFEVDLISAVHVADASYFQDLNHRFGGYDAVLYELVKAEGADVPRPGQRSASGVSGLQRLMTSALDLTFQLDKIDYTAPNFVHADLDIDTFRQKQAERGESLLNLMLRQMLRELGRAPGPATRSAATRPASTPPVTAFDAMELTRALQTPDKHRQLKLMLARAFNDIERSMAGLDDRDDAPVPAGKPRAGSAILTDRNDAALAVVRRVRGEGKKRVAVFYGAAHMPDLAEQLTRHDKLVPAGTEWLTAWDLTPPTPPTPSTPTSPVTPTPTPTSRPATPPGH